MPHRFGCHCADYADLIRTQPQRGKVTSRVLSEAVKAVDVPHFAHHWPRASGDASVPMICGNHIEVARTVRFSRVRQSLECRAFL
jgi:hypothetical protein